MTTTLSICRWNWCTKTFLDHASLIVHVEEDHLAKAVPVKRKDVTLLQRVEDGTSLQESVGPRVWVSDEDHSQSQSLSTSRRVEQAVMTDPVAPVSNVMMMHDPTPHDQSPKRGSSRAAGSTPMPSPRPPAKENILPMKFSEMRGSPSPAPSLVPPSPGTGAIINRMKQATVFPVSPRRSSHSSTPHPNPRPHHTTKTPHATPRPHRTPLPKPSPKLTPLKGTPRTRDLLLYPSLSTSSNDGSSEGGDAGAAGAVDPDASQEIVESQLSSLGDVTDEEMDIDPVVQNGFNSQWQPQSQLPLSDSLGGSSVPMSTIDPNQLHSPFSYIPDHHRTFRDHERKTGGGGSMGSNQSPSKPLASPVAGSSQDHGTSRPPSPAPHPPSPSTLDISIITTTESPQSARRPSSHHASRSPSISRVATARGVSGSGLSTSQSQGSGAPTNELPFESGFGFGYGDGYGDSQQLQTQLPLKQSSYDSSSWSQG